MTPEELKSYIDGQLTRTITDIATRLGSQREEILAIIASNDLRYQQRFDAQSKALDFAAAAAKEAVTVAITGADKTALKTEQAADKRFADLGDLIREQFKGVNGRIDAQSDRVKLIEERLGWSGGESAGAHLAKAEAHDSKMDLRGLVAIGISVIIGVLSLLTFLLRRG